MIARREFVLGAAAGALMQPRSATQGIAAGDQRNFDVPAARAIATRYPWRSGEVSVVCGAHLYPEMALPEEMPALHKALKSARVIVTQACMARTFRGDLWHGGARKGRARRRRNRRQDHRCRIGPDSRRLASRASASSFDRRHSSDPKVATEASSRRRPHEERVCISSSNPTLPVIAAMKDALAARR